MTKSLPMRGVWPACAPAPWAWKSCTATTLRPRSIRTTRRRSRSRRAVGRSARRCARSARSTAAIIADAFGKRWIDRADNVGKRSGAFSWGVYGVHPYVFLTWRDSYRNAFTLAHELGHTGHYELSMRAHPRSTISQDAFTVMVEAPSTANELLLGQHLLNTTTDPRHRRWLLVQLAETFTTNMVGAMLSAHFERRLYELAEAGKPLNASTLMEVQGDVLERFYGDTRRDRRRGAPGLGPNAALLHEHLPV